MKSKRLKKLFLSALCMALAGAVAMGGCAGPGTPGDLMAGIQPRARKTDLGNTDPSCPTAATAFGLELLRHSLQAKPGENTLLSPLSVLNALAMTAGGAQGDTLAQMESAFGAELTPLREFLAAYNNALPSGEKYSFHQANSLWVKEGEADIQRDFLQLNGDYFGAGLYQKPFDDTTLEEVNGWVDEHTHGMVPKMLEKIPEDTLLMLINALAFEAEWEDVYEEYDVRERVFTQEDGAETVVNMMGSTEGVYIKDEGLAQGFMKFYADRKYAFAALLPKEGLSLGDYLEGLTGERLRALLTGAQDQAVLAEIPKFEADYGVSLAEALQAMGMKDAFDEELADFYAMGSGKNGEPLYISDVLHKTHISVYEQGTKAGAATVVAMAEGAALMDDLPQVYLNRPFLYMIVDTENRLPIFLGAMYGPQDG